MDKLRVGIVALVGAVAVMSAACDSQSAGSEVDATTTITPDLPLSYVWSADEGIDLLGRSAELVRAASEAGEYAFFVGPDHGFPGYQQAVSGQSRNHVDEVFVQKNPLSYTQKPRTLFRHITDFTDTGRAVKATVCQYTIYPEPGRTDAPPNTDQFALQEAVAVELANSGTDAGRPGIEDKASNKEDPRAHRPPTWDVFGSWRIEKLRVFEPSQLPDGCARLWRQQFPDSYQDPGSNIVRVPADVEIPTQPVAVQYPEWIGPAKPE